METQSMRFVLGVCNRRPALVLTAVALLATPLLRCTEGPRETGAGPRIR